MDTDQVWGHLVDVLSERVVRPHVLWAAYGALSELSPGMLPIVAGFQHLSQVLEHFGHKVDFGASARVSTGA
jgi:hypothetical protein